MPIGSRLLTGLGGAALLAVLLVNPWTVARFLTLDGMLQPLNWWIVLLANCLWASLGLLLLAFRGKPGLQIRVLVSLILTLAGLVLVDFALGKLTAQEALHWFQANPHGTGSYRLRPGLRMHTHSGEVFSTNSLGMRWREVSRECPPGISRIAFLGDSFTEGESADTPEQAFVGVFDQLVRPEKQEALNFGVGGYGLDDEELYLREDVLDFHPQTVILNFFSGNDFRDTWLGVDKFNFDADYVTRGWRQPNFDDKIPPQYRQKGGVGKWLAEHSTIYSLLQEGRLAGAGAGQARLQPFQLGPTFTLYTFWSQQPYPEVAYRACQHSLQVLDEVRKLCESHRMRFMIMAIPFREQVYALEERGPNFDIAYPQKYVEDFSTDKHLPYLDLLPQMRQYVQQHPGVELYKAGHFNNLGHKLAGEWLYQVYRQNGW